jgi:hypothetical protein
VKRTASREVHGRRHPKERLPCLYFKAALTWDKSARYGDLALQY